MRKLAGRVHGCPFSCLTFCMLPTAVYTPGRRRACPVCPSISASNFICNVPAYKPILSVFLPILSIFIVGLLFKNVDAKAGITSVVFGVFLYGALTFEFSPIHHPFGLHYIHLMFFTLICCVALALIVNRVVFGKKASLISRESGADSIDAVAP